MKGIEVPLTPIDARMIPKAKPLFTTNHSMSILILMKYMVVKRTL